MKALMSPAELDCGGIKKQAIFFRAVVQGIVEFMSKPASFCINMHDPVHALRRSTIFKAYPAGIRVGYAHHPGKTVTESSATRNGPKMVLW